MTNKAILLINVGTPDAPSVGAVRRFLSAFLNDKRVIDLPWVLQKILVNLIIVPFRAPKSAKLYRQLWTNKGSALLLHSEKLKQSLQTTVGDKATVFLGMRYGNPSLTAALAAIKAGAFQELVVFPLFPHYASSTSGTAIEAVLNEIKKWNFIPKLKVVDQFYDNSLFLDAWEKRISDCKPAGYDYVVFTYHGLPNRHLDKNHVGISHSTCGCHGQMPAHGMSCYRATCYATTRLLATRLQLKAGHYGTSFQSRLSKNWMTPFTDELLDDRLKKGDKRVLVVAPSFVADCLETSVEIGIEYKDNFLKNGGEVLTLVESLNNSELWVNAVAKIALGQ